MPDNGVVLFNQVQAYLQQVNTTFIRRPISPGTVSNDVCWTRTGQKGTQIVFPVRMFGNAPKARAAYEQIPATPAEEVNFSATMSRVAPDAEWIPWTTVESDLYGIFQVTADMQLLQAQSEYDYELAGMLGNGQSAAAVVGATGIIYGGATDYDNLPFFNATKLANPNRPWVGTFANYAPGTNLDRAGLVAGFQALDVVPGPDGRPMRMPGKYLVVVSTEDQYDRASVYLHGTIRANAQAGASESNPESEAGNGNGQGGGLKTRAGLIKLPDLNKYDGGKGWYIFKIASAEYRPLTMNVCVPPLIGITGLNPNDLLNSIANGVRCGWQSFFGPGYAWPQLAWKAVEQ